MNEVTVLIIDDALFMRTVLKKILTDGGYQVVGEAENGLIGVQQYKELNPDVVFLDITMEVMDGIAAARYIKTYDPHAKIIMCSAMTRQQAYLDDAKEVGAQGIIVKPFNKKIVLTEIEKVLS